MEAAVEVETLLERLSETKADLDKEPEIAAEDQPNKMIMEEKSLENDDITAAIEFAGHYKSSANAEKRRPVEIKK
jgi:hypothetical protein